MEPVHRSREKPWIHQEKIHVASFIQECVNKGIEHEVNKKETFAFQDLCSSVSTEAATLIADGHSLEETVARDCHVSLLDCEGEEFLSAMNFKDLQGLKDESTCLESVKLLKKKLEEGNKGKLSFKFSTNDNKNMEVTKSEKTTITSNPTAVLTVQLFRPIDPARREENVKSDRPVHLDMEVEVISSQKLTQLRKCISCPSDFNEVPNSFSSLNTSEVSKSGFFFINDTFYNDLSGTGQQDYSQVILDWAVGRGIGPFDTNVMSKTVIQDLTIQLGYPYVYVHQGNCEHLLVFKDIRLMNRRKETEKDFPRVVHTARRCRIICYMCKTNTAAVIVQDMNLPSSPFFFCTDCRDIFYKTGKPDDIIEQSYVDKTALL